MGVLPQLLFSTELIFSNQNVDTEKLKKRFFTFNIVTVCQYIYFKEWPKLNAYETGGRNNENCLPMNLLTLLRLSLHVYTILPQLSTTVVTVVYL